MWAPLAGGRAICYKIFSSFVKWFISLFRFPPGFQNVKVLVELYSRAPRRVGGVGKDFTDRSSVGTVHPYVEWFVGVDEVGIAI